MQQPNRGLLNTIGSDDLFEAITVRRPLLVYSFSIFLLNVFRIQRVKLQDPYFIIQQTNRGLLTAIASDDLFEAMALSRPLSVYSLLRK